MRAAEVPVDVKFDVEIEDVVAVDKHDVTAFGGVEGVAEPVASGFGDFAAAGDTCTGRIAIVTACPEITACARRWG
ncbi:MAG: hypothetical protein AB1925_27055 [Actinomycetota bacterium]